MDVKFLRSFSRALPRSPHSGIFFPGGATAFKDIPAPTTGSQRPAIKSCKTGSGKYWRYFVVNRCPFALGPLKVSYPFVEIEQSLRPSEGFRFIFLPLLTRSYYRTISILDGSGKEGTVSTASRNCRNHVQRLRERGKTAPRSIGSRREDPGALWSPRLQWQNNLGGKHQTPCDPGLCQSDPEAKTAASQGRALSLTNPNTTPSSICRLEARAGTSPPPSSFPKSRGPP